mgnify:CR=1 FL=1
MTPHPTIEALPDRYVNREPFNPQDVEKLTPEQERFFTASQWRLMWWRFKRHRIAVVSMWFLAILYGSTLITEFIAPYDLHTRNARFVYAPPQRLHLFHEGSFVGPFVYGFSYKLDKTGWRRHK